MKIRELVKVTVKFPKASLRKDITWNLAKNAPLREAIEECLKTGRTAYRETPVGNLYKVRPEFPLIDSAMERPENKSLMKVNVTVYTQAWHLGVDEKV